MPDEEGDNLLIALVQLGDAEAFEKLLMRLHKPMRRYVTTIVGDSMADDILQEIALKIYRQIKFLREPRAFQAWVYRIATRTAFVHLKREKRRQTFEDDPEVLNSMEASTSPLEDWESGLPGLLDRLSPASRAVLLLHYQQHLSLEETAAVLDIPVGTAKSRLSYGVAKLRNFLKEREKDERSKSESDNG